MSQKPLTEKEMQTFEMLSQMDDATAFQFIAEEYPNFVRKLIKRFKKNPN